MECVFKDMMTVPAQGVAGGYGVVFHQSNDGRGSEHVVIRNCVFEKTVIRHAIYIQSSNDMLITNNVIYGTTEYNSDTIIARLNQYNQNPIEINQLTTAELDSIDVNKHMTKYDSAISYRGCTNVRILNNYFREGIIVLNGSKAPTATSGVEVKGRFFFVKDNVIKSICIPPYKINPALFNKFGLWLFSLSI